MTEPFLCENIGVDGAHLLFAGQDTAALAVQYGTPLYLMDEDRIRERCRTYRTAMRSAFGEKGRVLYASKAAAFRRMAAIMCEEGMDLDVVSVGEIATAKAAGFPMERVFFHSSNKTDADIAYAIECGVGVFVVDCAEELDALAQIAAEKNMIQPILLRLTPGIDPHTYAAVATGKVDSKFGFAIETGAAEAITAHALTLDHVRLDGFHCHVGSQVCDADVFLRSARIMLGFMADMRDRYGLETKMLDLGGGYGVRYLPSDPEPDIPKNIAETGAFVCAECERLSLPLPIVALEPGRSIVADAGMTLYTVGTVKRIPDVANYVSVDGGMTDNIRYALYGAPYTVLPANRMDEPRTFRCTVVGRCCESGDIIQPDVLLPETMRRGDLLAVCTTGAYHYSMASNYNRLPRPPIVMLSHGDSYVAVRRETEADILTCDVE